MSDVTNYYNGFFNQRWVQQDLGVRVNFTANDYKYQETMFTKTGNVMVQDISLLEHVLDKGVGVALVFGDRDYKCNCKSIAFLQKKKRCSVLTILTIIGIGAERLSLAMNYPSAPQFRQAGYADIRTNATYKGGVVRQHGNVSFSRVFEAGHAVAAYQPQTVYEIFQRSMFGKDVATGEESKENGTRGPLSSWGIRNEVPQKEVENQCYTYVAGDTCTEEQLGALADGSAVVKEFVVVEPRGKSLGDGSGGKTEEGSGGKNEGGSGGGPTSGAGVVGVRWVGVVTAFAVLLAL